MTRLFDNYIMIDWSAASKPNTGSDSIWIGVLKRDVRLQLRFEHFNPPTRKEAIEIIINELQGFEKRGDKTLVGFDFAFGYPKGTALALGIEANWRGMSGFLSKEFIDKPDNDNNRFQLASKMNRLMSGANSPFWGTPPKFVNSFLSAKKPAALAKIPEMRIADIDGSVASSVFKLYAPGSVGSQTITGIPYVAKLREKFPNSRIWPFEIGFEPLNREGLENIDIVFAETYPSMLKTKPLAGETKDLAQIRALALHFAELDDGHKLGAVFGGKRKFSDEEIEKITSEEAYILGI